MKNTNILPTRTSLSSLICFAIISLLFAMSPFSALALEEAAPASEFRMVFDESNDVTARKGVFILESPETEGRQHTVESGQVQVVLGKNYFWAERPHSSKLFNFDTRRAYYLDTKRKQFIDMNLLTLASIRFADFTTKLRNLPEKDPDIRTVMLEQSYAMQRPQDGGTTSATTFEELHKGDTTIFSYKGRVLAELTASSQDLPEEYARSLSHFLIYYHPTHPQICRAILATHRVPLRLTNYFDNGWADEKATLNLVSAGPVQSPRGSAVPADYQSSIEIPTPPAFSKVPNTAKEAISFVTSAIARGANTDAMLAVLEWKMMTGKQLPASLIASIKKKAATDANLSTLLSVVARNKSPQATEAGINKLSRLPLTKKYILEVYRGYAQIAQMDFQPGIASFQRALASNPKLVEAYGALGRVFYENDFNEKAFQCAELGSRLVPDHPALKGVRQIENDVLKDFPDHF